jgi:hypothetical protein
MVGFLHDKKRRLNTDKTEYSNCFFSIKNISKNDAFSVTVEVF